MGKVTGAPCFHSLSNIEGETSNVALVGVYTVCSVHAWPIVLLRLFFRFAFCFALKIAKSVCGSSKGALHRFLRFV